MCLPGLENRECQRPDPTNPQKALTVKLPDGWSRATPVFDEENLVSCAGLVPVMALAEQTGLSELVAGKVAISEMTAASAGTDPAGKLTAIAAGMACGGDRIYDLNVRRSRGKPGLFDQG